jgi:hypothetical protein
MTSVLEPPGHDDALLIRYLLGDLPADQAEPLDERSIVDDSFVARLDAVERELIDAYVRRDLPAMALQQFRSFYLSSPSRLQRVAFAQAFSELDSAAQNASAPAPSVATVRKPKRSWLMFPRTWSLGFAAATFALLLGAGYLSIQNSALRRRVHEIQGELNTQRSAVTAASQELEQLRRAQASLDQLKAVALFLLPPTRGVSRLPSVAIPSDAGLMVISLGLDSVDFKTYRAALKDPSTDRVLWRSSDLFPGENKVVSLSFAASLLGPQTYVVELTGSRANGSSQLLASYPFRVRTG